MAGRKITRNLHSVFFPQFGFSFHNLNAFDSMHNGAEVEMEKTSKRHYKDFTSLTIGGNQSVRPTNEHKDGRSQVDGDGKIDDRVQHSGYSPFAFLNI